MLDGTYFFECKCGADEHTLRFVYNKEDHELYAAIFLDNWLPWYKRVWQAIKYACGYKCKYGHWDSWALRNDDIDRLRELLDRFKRDYDSAMEEIDEGLK